MATTVSAHAPAKVNLALSVGAARADGMHEIASWMVTTDFGDDLLLRRLSAGTPSRYAIQWAADARRRSEIDWSVSKDLAVRAHLALEAALGRALPVQMLLEKRIPVGGGLGGGSSNAAAMLRALDALFDLRLRREYLEEVARTLGSDVPFLVRGGSAFVEGLGERVSAAPAHDTHLVLVFPEAHCPTGQVYRAFDAVRRDARVDAERVRALARGRVAVDAPFNDLAGAACTVAPALDELREEIARLARQPVHVSGSGSTLFLVADDPFHAEALAGSVEMKLALPAVMTRTAPVREEHVDGAPRVREVPLDDDD
ncbi:MAG: 4-(cytidine 5'-diphospho)-2-C-methyl-D-erythritol kinase [Planctomycetaceae bacterium]|nr:4-(cytidine 5'-diphospho)-2-C-methyl-D-erythritol kinase [Planctomycetaceae bacterium]